MLKIREKVSEEEVLERVKQLPENMKIELLDFLDFLIQKSRKREGPQDVKKAVSAVEDTWGSIRLSREVLKFVAEDKELEYEV
jgi:type IV secretory pathway ATPase VirB11/archaellum biosynthesis ATPase